MSLIAPVLGGTAEDQRRIAVTGASGFVGSALTRRLASRGHEVVAVSRGALPAGSSGTARQIAGLDDAEGLRRALESTDVVVHLAARVHVMREHHADPLAAFRRVNVEGTRAVHEAARAAGVRRFVFLSSIKAMGEGSSTPYREADTPRPVDAYGISKLEAEQAIAKARARGGLEYVVLRPTLVYGPGVAGNFRRLLRLAELSRRIPVPLGKIVNRRSFTSVDNLSSAIEAAATHPAAADQTFLVSDGEDLSTSDLLARLAAGLGSPARLLPCPTRLLRVAAAALGRKEEVERLLGSLVVDPSHIQRQLDWKPPQSVTDGLAETAAWWRRESSARPSL